MTADALAEHFGVSARTMYRDIATLTRQGAVIDGGKGVGYLLRNDFFLPPLSFDAGEAAALMLGLRFVLRRGDAALMDSAVSARAKLKAVLPSLFDDEAAASSPLLMAPPAPQHAAPTTDQRPAHDTVGMLGTVRDALTRYRKLRLTYLDLRNRTTQRLVWPIALGWFDELEMLAAWCETRGAFRHFRVDRIRSVVLEDEPPPRPRQLLLTQYRALEPGISL